MHCRASSASSTCTVRCRIIKQDVDREPTSSQRRSTAPESLKSYGGHQSTSVSAIDSCCLRARRAVRNFIGWQVSHKTHTGDRVIVIRLPAFRLSCTQDGLYRTRIIAVPRLMRLPAGYFARRHGVPSSVCLPRVEIGSIRKQQGDVVKTFSDIACIYII